MFSGTWGRYYWKRTVYNIIFWYMNLNLLADMWTGVQHFLQDCLCAQRKTQISLHIHQRRLISHRCPTEDTGSLATHRVPPDQTAQLRRLIWILNGRTWNLVGNAVPRLICWMTFTKDVQQGDWSPSLIKVTHLETLFSDTSTWDIV